MRRSTLAATMAAIVATAIGSAFGADSVTCTASGTTINFGAYDALAGSAVDGAGSFTVTCTQTGMGPVTVTYTAKLATAPPRQLAPPAGSDRLTYGVYVDPARTQPWGDGTGGTFTIGGTVTITGPGSVSDSPKNFYGRIAPGGQDVSAASPGPPPTIYRQTLTVTVTCTPSPPC